MAVEAVESSLDAIASPGARTLPIWATPIASNSESLDCRVPGVSAPVFIWQLDEFPRLSVKYGHIAPFLVEAGYAEGVLVGQWSSLTTAAQTDVIVNASIVEAIATHSVRKPQDSDQRLEAQSGESSRCASNIAAIRASLKDASDNCELPVSRERLLSWQNASKPSDAAAGASGFRDDASTSKWGVRPSGSLEARPLFVAPPAAAVPQKLTALLTWFNSGQVASLPVRIAMLTLLFFSIMPLRDRNWLVCMIWLRLILCRHFGTIGMAFPLVSLLHRRRKELFRELRYAQRGTLDATSWVSWFLRQYRDACCTMSHSLNRHLKEGRFFSMHSGVAINDRQITLIKHLLALNDQSPLARIDTTSYGKLISTASRSTCQRDLSHLVENRILRMYGQGKATYYMLIHEDK